MKAWTSTITIGKQRWVPESYNKNFQIKLRFHFSYNLAGAICPRADHFTATIVYAKGRFSKYDDLYKFGVKHNEGGDDAVETAVYVIEMNDDD